MEIDKLEVQKHFRRSRLSYDENALVQKVVIDRLCPMILASMRSIPRTVLEIGCGTGLLTAQLKHIFTNNNQLFINDLVEDLCYKTADVNELPADCCLPGDIERMHLPIIFDLIVSTSTFQWFTDPGGTFRRLSKKLETGGVMLFTTFGRHNLREIRLTTGAGLAYRSREEMVELLSPYFEVERVVEEFHLFEFDSPLAVLQHLKRTGVNISGEQPVWTRGRINAFTDDYNARFALDGKVPLTYHPFYFVCRKKEVVETDDEVILDSVIQEITASKMAE